MMSTRFTGRRARLAVAALALGTVAVVPVVTAAPASAAQPGQLCRTNVDAKLYRSAREGDYVILAAGSLVRILKFEDEYHYLVRFSDIEGQLERIRVDQSSCYFQ